eukprot:gene30158-35138_t
MNLSKPNPSPNIGLGRRRSSSKHGVGSRRGLSILGPLCPVPQDSALKVPLSSPQLFSESFPCSPQDLGSMPMHPSRLVSLGALAPTLVGGSMPRNPNNQCVPRILSNPSLTNPSLNLLEQRIISAHQITLNHKLSGGNPTRKSSGGLATRKSLGGTTAHNSSGGNPTSKSSGGLATRMSLGGTTAHNSSGGNPTRKLSGGLASRMSLGGTTAHNSSGGTSTSNSTGGLVTDKSSGGIATHKSSGGTPPHKSLSGTASCKSLSGTGQVLAAGTGRVRVLNGDSCSRLLGKSAVGSTRTLAYIMTDLEDFNVINQRSCHPGASLPTPSLSNPVPAFQPGEVARGGASAWGEDSFEHSRRSAGKVKALPSPFEQLPDALTTNVKEVSKLRKLFRLFSCFGSN